MTCHSCPSARERRAALLLATSLITTGCQLVFGKYEAGAENSASDAGTGGAPASTQPAGGAAQGGAPATGGAAAGGAEGGYCDGSKLYTCADLALLKCENQTWLRNDTCTKPAFCNVTTGKCDKCGLNERQCATTADGGTAVFACTDPQVGFSLETACDKRKGLYCADDVKRCVVCELEETHCIIGDAGISDHANRCSDNRTDWETVPCYPQCTATGGKTDKCPICTAGNTVCQPTSVGTWLVRLCNNAGTWTTSDECTGNCIEATNGAPAACE